MTNPFKYGTVVYGNDFANREKELKELAAKLKETIRIFLLAPRRYGKTSLIKSVLNTLKKKGILRKEKEGYIFEDVFFGRWAETIVRE